MSKLIGTNPNQVPSNADLGTAAFMDKKDFLLSKGSEMSAINAIIPKTALDVFVYDTTKDSDGGAWRKRTQHTSWYNEKLNTTTRGSRKEFPAVAVIVVEINKVTIYDGDDPIMPMWMTFPVNNSSWLKHSGSGGCKAVVARNGIMVTGGDLRGAIVRFIADDGNTFEAGYNYEHRTITTRNTSVGPATGPIRIANNSVNDVAITVLPNAPIDSATGLPIPTIAVATAGGVSVIKDDGTVVDITYTGIYKVIMYIAFTKDNNIIFSNDGYATLQRWVKVYKIPAADLTTSSGTNRSGALFSYVPYTTGTSYGANPDGMFAEGVKFAGITGDAIATDDIGVVKLSEDNKSQAYISSDYNTGWMNGDIKLATLSDTDTTNAVGTELVTNGTFASDTSWTKGTGWTISGGTAVASSVASGVKIESTSFTVPAGYYTIALDVTTSASTHFFGFQGATSEHSGVTSAQGKVSITKYLNAGSHTAYIGAWSSGLSGTFDNFSVRLAEQDRSVNGNGLQVFGTVTKTAVATGADLVGYGPFSSANFLQQPVNTDINNLNPRAIMCWVKASQHASAYQYLWTISDDTTYHYGLSIYAGTSGNGGKLYSYDQENGIGQSSYMIADGNWHCVVFTDDETTKRFYVDGKLEYSVAHSYDLNSANKQNMQLRIGTYESGSHAMVSGSLSLLRVSGTIPTPEQIVKIYNDERHLFQENAKATLYGTSDAVTALAYDDDTELLHVGTSAGRSDFQGLRRINNTTRAIGTAISAVDGFVVEE